MEGYETTREVAERLGVNDSRIRQLLLEGRFPGAIKVGSKERGQWLIPKGAKPVGTQQIEKESE